MAFGFTLNKLLAMYQTQFPVMQNNENNTWYDAFGRIIRSANSDLNQIPTKRKKGDNRWSIRSKNLTESEIALGWEDIKDLKEGIISEVFEDDTLPGGPITRTIEYHAPFEKCDREEDYKVAWEVFTERFSRSDLI